MLFGFVIRTHTQELTHPSFVVISGTLKRQKVRNWKPPLSGAQMVNPAWLKYFHWPFVYNPLIIIFLDVLGIYLN